MDGQIKELAEGWGAVIGAVLLGIVGVFYKHVRRWANKWLGANDVAPFTQGTLRANSQVDFAIRESLIRLQERTKADRAYVVALHNGGYDASGFKFTKMSCRYEVVKLGASREMQNSIDMSLSEYPEIAEKLTGSDDVTTVCVASLSKGAVLKQFLMTQGVTCILGHRIFLRAKGMDVLYGFIGISFCDKQCDGEGTCAVDEHLAQIQEATELITIQLKKRK